MGSFPEPSTQFKSGANAVEAARRGGLVRSDAKKNGARMREMKKRGLTDADAKWLMERIEDPTTNIFHIQKLLDEIIAKCPEKPGTQILAIQQMINLHKAHHGEKVHSTNLNMNVNVSLEEWERRLNDNISKSDQ